MITRRGLLTALGGIFAGAFGLAGYAGAVEPRWRLAVTRYRPAIPAWPDDLPLRIVFLSDLHVGEPHVSLERLASIVETSNALRPDLILLGGDYVAGNALTYKTYPPAEWAGVLGGLRAPAGVFAVLGNHDWWYGARRAARRQLPDGAEPVRLALEGAGIPVLENRAVALQTSGRRFWLAGLGDQLALVKGHGVFAGVDDLPGTLAQIDDDAPALLLAHEPDIFASVPNRVALTLSGHTHGGQIRLFGYSPVVPSRFGNRYAYGQVVEDNRHLIVSGGIGTSILPIRFGVPPEIVVIELGARPLA